MADPLPFQPISVDGFVVCLRPCGVKTYTAVRRALRAMPDDEEDLDAVDALADLCDTFADPAGVLPSQLTRPAFMQMLMAWLAGVRDAAIPPTSAGDSPSPVSIANRAARRRTSPRKSA